MSSIQTFMQINGIEGSATEKAHPKWIELDSLEFHTGGGDAQASRMTSSGLIFSTLDIKKRMDKSSTILWGHVINKDILPQVIIEICHRNLVTAKYELSDVMFLERLVSTAGDRIQESLSLSYARISETFVPYDEQGNECASFCASHTLAS